MDTRLLDTKLDEYTKEKGFTVAQHAVKRYRESTPDFDSAWVKPMNYASGYTAAYLASLISKDWVVPLKRQARIAGLSTLVAIVLLGVAMFYVWSLVSFSSFTRFLIAFAPAVAALLFSAAKSYKAWAEARKCIAEAKVLGSSAQGTSGDR
jgi:hypothetical protein